VPFISVDSETTRDVDDAFHLETRPEGGWLLRLALARPTLGWDLDSPLGRAVAQRATSVYLPEGDSHMLPETLGLELFSLLQGRERPALVLELILAEDASGSVTLQGCTPRLAWVRVRENVSYNAAEAAIQANLAGGETVHGAMLTQAWQLAERLRQARLEQGAVIIERQEPEIVLKGEGEDIRVVFEVKPETPRSQLLVSEFMILVNSAMALWAREQGLPLLHRTQDIALPKTAFGVWSAPHEVHQVVKNLTSAVLEPAPRPHASLGVSAYSPISSPLRRYSDFLNMLQVQRLLERQEPRFDQAGLESLLPFLSTRLDMVGRIQRFRPRYWKLLSFKQQGKEARHEAVVVDEGPQFVFLSLPREQFFVRGPRGLFSEKLVPGQRLCIRLGKIDPLNNEVHVLEALEDEDCPPPAAVETQQPDNL
jgi:exoribonuclease II